MNSITGIFSKIILSLSTIISPNIQATEAIEQVVPDAAEQVIEQVVEAATDESATTVDEQAAMKDSSSVKATADKKIDKMEIKIFFSYECVHCAIFSDSLKTLRDREDIVITYYHNPFTTRDAHKAAICAGEQNRFYDMHDLIFANRNNLSKEKMSEHAQILGLDLTAFDKCFLSEETDAKIDQDKELARKLGVTAVPTSFIDDEKVVGAVPIENFEKMIKEAKNKKIE